MVVKEKVGRRRYIIVENTWKLEDIIGEIKKIDNKSKVITKIGDFSIILCRHWYKERIIDFLKSYNIRTYRTTGTIKQAKKVIKNLQEDGGGGY